jgi:signal transduction histidine kinase/ligand-binding sensor domain-containing protein
MKRYALLLFLALSICTDCISQRYPFIHYTPKDGLVSNNAHFMFQDSRGLLYISTLEGLSVYDGARFTNYTTKNGMASNIVDDIIEMGEDSIWLMPNRNKIDCLVKGRIKEVQIDGFCPIVSKMIKRPDGSYYALCDEGLYLLEKNRFTKIPLTDSSGRDAGRYFESGLIYKNKLFIITDPNVQSIGEPGRLIVYDPKQPHVTIGRSAYFFYVELSPDNDILVATDKGVKKIDEAPLAQNIIRFSPLPSIYGSAEKLHANYLFADSQQNLWLCTSAGLYRIDHAGETKLFNEESGLPVNFIGAVFEDREHTIWFVNGQTGISRLTNPYFESYRQLKPGFFAHEIYTSRNTDSVWFLDAVTNTLLLAFGGVTKTFQLPNGSPHPPYRLFATDVNKYYLTDMFDIFQCDLSEDRAKLRLLYSDSTRNANITYTCMKPDGYGNMIVCSEKIIVIQPGKKILVYPLGYLSDAFVITKDHLLWTFTRGQRLFEFRIHPEDPDHYLEFLKKYEKELPEFSPRSIAADQQGNIWVGTRNDGIFCLHFNGLTLDSWKQITVKNGLSGNFISYLHTDAEDNLWACSPVGLDKIQWNDGKVQIENITLSNNLYQRISKIQTTRSGVHWVVTQSGVLKINPGKLAPVSFQPKIIFREIDEGTNRIDPTEAMPSFSHLENNISFSLAVPSFVDEKQTRFSYLLEGSASKSWSDPSSHSVIDFINLAPGKYRLRARASFLNLHYAGSEIQYSFVIRPAWWQTGWFRLVLAALLMVISGLMIRNYYQRKINQQRVILEKREAVEKERARIATDMHDDLGSGLSTIRFLSEKVKRNTFSDVTRTDVEKIQFASNELIEKMNEIIWSMNEKNNSLENLIFYTRSYSMEYCGDNNLLCQISLPEQIPSFSVSGEFRRNVFLTVKEILHNIVKHAGADNVQMMIETAEGLDIVVRDNGVGFHENQRTGGGNGLRNMRKRIESIGGTINIQNGQGITVILKLPLTEA